MLNLCILLEESAKSYSDKTAIVSGDVSLTYAEWNALANRIANALVDGGIVAGDKVALSCPNIMWYPALYYGILKAGAVAVPMSVLLKSNEIQYILEQSDAKIHFCFPGNEQMPVGKEGLAAFESCPSCGQFVLLEEGVPHGIDAFLNGKPDQFSYVSKNEDDTALILFTSGTTGAPKGAEITHFALLENARVARDLQRYTPDEKILIVMALSHIFPQSMQFNSGILAGATMVLCPRFEPGVVIDLLIKHRITAFAGVPSIFWALANHCPEYPENPFSLRFALTGGGSIAEPLAKAFEGKLKAPLLEVFGMTESSGCICFNATDVSRKYGSIGKPVWGIEVRIVDEHDRPLPPGEKGELIYRGHNLMKGYYRAAEITAHALRDGWMHSGDIAFQDEDGYFYIVDRLKDMINRNGWKVYPRELEEVLMRHEGVSLVAVVGVPHPEVGEEIKAFVVPKPGANLTEESLIAWCKERMASFKYPRLVEFREALPLNNTGKIAKKMLK